MFWILSLCCVLYLYYLLLLICLRRLSFYDPCVVMSEEPVFLDLLRSPRIDSQPDGLVRKPYFSYGPARLHRLSKSIPRNRFLVSINIYKNGLCSLSSIMHRNGFLSIYSIYSFPFYSTVALSTVQWIIRVLDQWTCMFLMDKKGLLMCQTRK